MLPPILSTLSFLNSNLIGLLSGCVIVLSISALIKYCIEYLGVTSASSVILPFIEVLLSYVCAGTCAVRDVRLTQYLLWRSSFPTFGP